MKLSAAQIEKLEKTLTELSQIINNAGYDDDESDLFENVVIANLESTIEEFET